MVSGELAGECLQTGFEGHGLTPQRAPLDTVYHLREHRNSVQRMVSRGYCDGLFPDTVCWTRLRNTWVSRAGGHPDKTRQVLFFSRPCLACSDSALSAEPFLCGPITEQIGTHIITRMHPKFFYANVPSRTQLSSRAAKRGGFKRGGFPIWTCRSFFVLFCTFWGFPDFSGIFPICSGMVRGFSRFVLFLFIGLLRAPTRNGPERVRDTIWTFPEKSGKPPGLETPRFSFAQHYKKHLFNFLFGNNQVCNYCKALFI